MCEQTGMRQVLFTVVLFSLVPSDGLAADTLRNLRQTKFFHARETVTVKDLIEALEELVVPLSQSDAVRKDYLDLRKAHRLSESDIRYLDYVKVRIAFEAARDGGLWHLRWDITNQEPSSKRIWKHLSQAEMGRNHITVTAECDELSAFFAYIVYRMSVRHVGLFWPTNNHTVAVWTVGKTRLVIPTSQIFLSDAATLGTKEFDPWTQKTIYEYRHADVPKHFTIPGHLARFLMRSLLENIDKPANSLQKMRNAQAARFGGS
jgi:hypothetical protein